MTAKRMTLTALAEMLDESPRTVETWPKLDMPVHRDAKGRIYVDPKEAIRWVRERDIERRPPTDIEEARARKLSAEAELAEHELAKARNELMTVADYDRVVGDAFSRVDGKLLALASRLAGAVVGVQTPAEGHKRIEKLVEEIRDELRRGDDIPDDPPLEDVA